MQRARAITADPRAMSSAAAGEGVQRKSLIGPAGIIALGVTVNALTLFVTGWRGNFAALMTAVCLFASSIPMLIAVAQRDASKGIANVFIVALLAKLLFTFARYAVAFSVYNGVADASGYHKWAVQHYTQFRALDFTTDLSSLSGTNFIKFVTGLVYTATGPNIKSGFLFFSWLGFWGLLLAYRAFSTAIPSGRRRMYAYLVFFLPSLLYWPSSIGKESLMILFIGISLFGVGHVFTGRILYGLTIAASGLWLQSLIRPHVAGMIAVSVAMAFLVQRSRNRAREGGIEELVREASLFAKFLGLVITVALAATLIVKTNNFLSSVGSKIDGEETSVLTQVSQVQEDLVDRTQQGGSSFNVSVLNNPINAPLAFVTVLFRPLIFESNSNLQQLTAGIEGTLLLLICIKRRWAIWESIKDFRRRPYVAFCLSYIVLFVFGFSSFGNFGLLARERVQVLPVLLVIMCLNSRTDAKAKGWAQRWGDS